MEGQQEKQREEQAVANVTGLRVRALSRLLVESVILLAAASLNPAAVLKEAAMAYTVDTEAIAAKVRKELTTKTNARKAAKPAPKTQKRQPNNKSGAASDRPLVVFGLFAGRTRFGTRSAANMRRLRGVNLQTRVRHIDETDSATHPEEEA